MSRTDKTKPHHVKVADGPRVEFHDHRNGVCELKADPDRIYQGSASQGQCYLDADWYDPIHRCGCWSCRGSWREQVKRQDKTKARRTVREWWRDA